MQKSWRGCLRRGNDGRGISKKGFWSARRCFSTRRGERSFVLRAQHGGGMQRLVRLVLRIQPRSGAAIVSAEPGALGAELLCLRLIKVNQATGLAVRHARGGAGSFFR